MKEKRPEDRELGYKLLTPLMRPLFNLYYSPKIIGKEKIPAEGGIITVSYTHLTLPTMAVV